MLANQGLSQKPPPGKWRLILDLSSPKGGSINDWVLKMPKMNAYMLTISQARKEFEGPAWWIYDHNYRLRAATSHNQSWTTIYIVSVSQVGQVQIVQE